MATDPGFALIGYRFMGKAHSHAYRNVSAYFPGLPAPRMVMLCGRDEKGVRAAAGRFGWQRWSTDWRQALDDTEIDVVDISAPGDVHHEIAVASAEAGKHIFCEKPLANTLPQAREMLDAVTRAGVRHMVCFNYRFVPAVRLAKRLLDEGRLGRIYHIRAQFLQDWILDPAFPLVWRLRKEAAGSGSLGDLGAHLIDMARYLAGEFEEVVGDTEIFVRERPLATAEGEGLGAKGSGETGEVTVDDAVQFLARFESGALGTFEATRFAPGHRCTNAFEINGSGGSIRFDFERMNELQVYLVDDPPDLQGFRTIHATTDDHPYGGVFWPGGHSVGYDVAFTNAVAELLEALRDGRQPVPDFGDGVRCQEVLAAVELSAEERSWVKVSEV